MTHETSRKLFVRSTAAIGMLSGLAVVVVVPRWTATSRPKVATCHFTVRVVAVPGRLSWRFVELVSWPRTWPLFGSVLSPETLMKRTARERSTAVIGTFSTLCVVKVAVPLWTAWIPVSTGIHVRLPWIAALVASGVQVWVPSAVFSDTRVFAFDEV